MARGRILSKSLSTSRRYARLRVIAGPLAEFCGVLYPLLVAHADDLGRLSGDVWTIQFAVCPTWGRDLDDIERALGYLADAKLIIRYDADDEPAIEIVHFARHQAGLKRRGSSTYAAPPEDAVREATARERRPAVAGPVATTAGHVSATAGPTSTDAGQCPAVSAQGRKEVKEGSEGRKVPGADAGTAADTAAAELPNDFEKRGARVRVGGLVRGPNPNHAFDGGRVHVPQSLHVEFRRRRGDTPDAERELFAWYADVADAWTNGAHVGDEPGADMFRFWRARYDERWPPTPAAESPRARKPLPSWAPKSAR